MTTQRVTSCFGRFVLMVAVTGAACAKDPETTAARYIASGDSYAGREQFEEAAIQYGNALKATPNDADLRYKLGRAYEQAGEIVKAYNEYARAADLDPENVDAQMRAGTLLLVAREFEAARTRAELALAADPNHVPAHILLGNALAGLNDTVSALRQIEQAITLDPSSAPAWTALGAVTFLGGRRAEAAEAFHKAVELAPGSVDARLALANYQWARGDLTAAEATLTQALAQEPQHAGAHRALALLYLTTRRAEKAEAHFRALATDTAGRLALADYYMGVGRNDDARTLLAEIERTGDRSDGRAARLRLAAIAYAEGHKEDAHRTIDAVIADRPRFAEARTAKARMLLADGASAEDAAMHAREAVKADANLPAAHYTLGLAALALRRFDEAERAFDQVTRLTPRAAAAQLQLARLRLARGEAGAAVSAAERAAHERPGDTQAAVLLSQGLRAQGHLDRAARELKARLADDPASPALHVELGHLAVQRRDYPAARAAFSEALRYAPQSPEARNGLIAVDLAERKVDGARARVAGWQRDAPGDAGMRILAARVELAAGQFPAAERMLQEVVAGDPSQLDAYELLGRSYVARGRIPDAIRQYEVLAARAPSTAASAQTMIGMLHDTQRDRASAHAAYQQALAADSRAGVAANNLAWILAEEGNLDEALRLALIAQESLRRRPEAEDTLGWVYLRQGRPAQALASFERARERAPRNPVYHYHLGLAYRALGDDERARAAFNRALEIDPAFSSASEARAQLAD